MNSNISKIETDGVNFAEVINWLWKEKIIILSISLIFFVSAFTYIYSLPKQYQTVIVLREIPQNLFLKFDNIIKLQQKQQTQKQQLQQTTFASLLEDEFHQKLNSFDNFNEFVKLNNSINSFKTLLKERQISAKDYFYNRGSNSKFGNLTVRRKVILKNKYYLNFPEELKGDQFLNEYVIFTFQNSLQYIKNELLLKITDKKNYFNQLLKISKKLSLKESLLRENLQIQKLSEGDMAEVLSYRPEAIQFQISFLEELIIEANNLNLKFDPILDKSSRPVRINAQSPLEYGILFSMVGFIFSLIYLVIRNIIKNTDKS